MSGVQVNECRVFVTQRGADWWATFRPYFDRLGRIAVVTASPAGDLVNVACDHDEHARWLANLMQERGIPASAVKVIR